MEGVKLRNILLWAGWSRFVNFLSRNTKIPIEIPQNCAYFYPISTNCSRLTSILSNCWSIKPLLRLKSPRNKLSTLFSRFSGEELATKRGRKIREIKIKITWRLTTQMSSIAWCSINSKTAILTLRTTKGNRSVLRSTRKLLKLPDSNKEINKETQVKNQEDRKNLQLNCWTHRKNHLSIQ